MPKISDTFRERLSKALQKRGSKQRLLEKTGISSPVLYGYLSGKNVPGLDAVERIAEGLGVSPLDLLVDASDDEETIERFSRDWNSLRRRAQKIPKVRAVFEQIDGLLKLFLDETKSR